MGVTDLWPTLSPGFGDRQSLPVFVSRFISQHGRPPRLAIDTYIYLFLNSNGVNDALVPEDAMVIRNFMAKLLSLTSLNVSYVVVFDGKLKPNKLRNGALAEDYDYDGELRSLRMHGNQDYASGEPLTEKLIALLTEYRIEYVRAPAEAEAECAVLQRCGVVDYVVTNDVDAFIFGATKVLRNFNRYKEDIFFSPTKAAQDRTYMVTPVHMNDITRTTGLDRKRLVFVATLMGGDYSSGTHRMGLQNAVKLALCGTPFAAFFHRSPTKAERKAKARAVSQEPPDFSQQLVDCFVDEGKTTLFDIWSNMRSRQDRQQRLVKFIDELTKSILEYPRDIFGRQLNLPYGVLIEETYILLYLFPLVSLRLFRFAPRTLSNYKDSHTADLTPTEESLVFEPDRSSWLEVVPRFNLLESEATLGSLCVTFTFKQRKVDIMRVSYETKHTDELPASQLSFIPVPFHHNLRNLLPRVIERSRKNTLIRSSLTIMRAKEADDEEFCMVRYLPQSLWRALFDEVLESEIDSQPSSQKERPETVWVPRNVLEMANPALLNEFDEDCKKYTTQLPEKKVQLTTLDTLGMKILSPTVSPRRRRKRGVSNSNQTSVTAFFKRSPSPTAAEDPFVDTTQSQSQPFKLHSATNNYSRMQLDLNSVPSLRAGKHQTLSPYSSPPKRVRRRAQALEISPDSSPVKAERFLTLKDTAVPSSSIRSVDDIIYVSSQSDCESDSSSLPTKRNRRYRQIIETSQES